MDTAQGSAWVGPDDSQRAQQSDAARKRAIDEINRGILQTKPSFDLAKQALDDWKAKLIENLFPPSPQEREFSVKYLKKKDWESPSVVVAHAEREALRMAEIFRANVIDASTEHFVFELTGRTSKIEQFITIMMDLGLIEVSRTGIAVLEDRSTIGLEGEMKS